MRFTLKKKIAVGAIAGAAILASSVGAYAYFTTTGGSGSGTASTGSASGVTVAITNDSVGDLVPAAIGANGAVVDTVNYSLTNNTNGDSYVTQVVISITPTWTAGTGPLPLCTPASFSINGAAVGTSVTVPVGKDLTGKNTSPANVYNGSFTLQLVENNANQNNCAGLSTIPLSVVAS